MPHTIMVDDDVFSALQQHAEPLVDDINSVLRRILELEPRAADSPIAEVSASTVYRSAPTGSVAFERSRSAAPMLERVRGRESTKQPNKPTKKPTKKSAPSRIGRGVLVPESDYEVPILVALAEKNGRAPASEVIDRVGELMSDRFGPEDLGEISSGMTRWKNRAQFVRLSLIQSGDMAKDSPRGVWEITEQGSARAADQK